MEGYSPSRKQKEGLKMEPLLWYITYSSCKEENGDEVRLAKTSVAKLQWLLITPDTAQVGMVRSIFVPLFPPAPGQLILTHAEGKNRTRLVHCSTRGDRIRRAAYAG